MELSRRMEIAFASPEHIARTQLKLLHTHVDYCLRASAYYRRILGERPSAVSGSVEELLDALPFTDKTDIENCNDQMCAVLPEQVADIVMSSGTTGKPTKVIYTEHDLQRLAYNEEKALLAIGLTALDTVLLTCTIDRCFVAGLAYFLGVRSVGAATIRSGHASMQSHLDIITRLDPTAIVGVPTFLRKLGLYMREQGLEPAGTSVSKMVCIGEPLRDRALALTQVGRDVEEIWQAKLFSTYATSEIVTTFCECEQQQGGHLHPDLAVVEIVDDAGKRLRPGEVGEVTVTPLAVEGMPLLRFRTGDVSFIIDEPCRCGRNCVRLGPIIGRKKQMLKIKGTTVYPPAVFAALGELERVNDYYLVVSSEDDLSDLVEVHVSVSDTSLTAGELQDFLQARIRVKPKVVIEPDAELRRKVYLPEQRKPVRFIDSRESTERGGPSSL